jgi:hypothetical protein
LTATANQSPVHNALTRQELAQPISASHDIVFEKFTRPLSRMAHLKRRPKSMALSDEFRAMSDDELARLAPQSLSILSASLDQMLAWQEIEQRRRQREEPIRREKSLAKHREYSRKAEDGGFTKPTYDAISHLFSRATYIEFAERGPYRFQYLPTWRDAGEQSYVLRYLDSPLEAVVAGIPDGGLLDGIDCVTKRQIMDGVMRQNLVIIRGQHGLDPDLFVDEIRFLTQHVSYPSADT